MEILLFAPTQTDEESYAVDMLVDIFGRDSNSRLFTNVSQRKGLAYGVSSKYGRRDNQGVICISGRVHSTRADEAIDTIFEEMIKLRIDLVPQDSLERLKRISRYNVAKAFETNAGHARVIGLKIDKGITPEYILEKMEEVTPEKIRDAAVRYFPQNRADGKYVLMLRDPLKK